MMNLVYYQPWSMMDRWRREIDELFTRSSDASLPALTNSTASWTPSVDLQEESDHFVLRADVPGVALKDIEVSAEDGTLTIRGERLAREHVRSDGFEHIERAAGTFLRRFTLPDSARSEAIKHGMSMGCSRSRFPSSLESRPSELR